MTDQEAPIPRVGEWYKNAAGDSFEIVAIDEEDGTIEVQYFDGAVEELDLESWDELGVESIEPPEDWSGSLDIEREDYGVDIEGLHGDEWNNPLDFLDRSE
ncbi:MAG TPA: DUF6763 family protein [Gammaproteobacteria bacterium]|nr:DUF6763 family protein [Gammaproteobacteria bacterium]